MLFLFSALTRPALAQPQWEKVSIPFDQPLEKIKGGAKGSSLFLTSGQNAYLIQPEGHVWEKIFGLGKLGSLNAVYPGGVDQLFVLTTEGVFETRNNGKNWQKTFSALENKGTNSLCLSSHPRDPEILYLGTARGLYLSMDGGQSWFKQTGAIPHDEIHAVLLHPLYENQMFAVTAQDFYASDNYGRSFRKTFHLGQSTTENFQDDTTPNEATNDKILPSAAPAISAAKISPFHPEEIFLGTPEGVFASRDIGKSWRPLTRNGLGNILVTDIEISAKDRTVFAATPAGIYRLENSGSRWTEIYEGLVKASAKSLALVPTDKGEVLYAIADNDVFKWPIDLPPYPEIRNTEGEFSHPYRAMDLRALIAREPTAGEVQRAAIRYADVGNGKIKRWHLASRLKALVPDLSLGKDFSVHNNVDLDRAGTNQLDLFILGPDSNSKGNAIDLDWKLGDLVWGSNQASIDSREKLMVELRNDIVNEITRLYFERRRLLMELYLKKPEDEKGYLDLLLRIDELTSYMDGLTGGYCHANSGKGILTILSSCLPFLTQTKLAAGRVNVLARAVSDHGTDAGLFQFLLKGLDAFR